MLSRFSKLTLTVLIVTLGMFAQSLPSSAFATTTVPRVVAVLESPDSIDRATTTTTSSTTAPPTTAPPTTAPPTTAPPTTAPPTTAPPTTAPPPTTPAPPPLPATPAPPPAPTLTEAQRVQRAYEQAVPAAWRGAISVTFELIDGNTSWGWPSGRIQISATHRANDTVLRTTIAHEFGHLIAFRYGAQNPYGAAPTGWPSFGPNPVESWADCVSHAFTGVNDPSHGLASCPPATLAWTSNWLAQGPGAH